MFSKNLYLTFVMFGCLGFIAAGRTVVGVSYMNEFVPEKN